MCVVFKRNLICRLAAALAWVCMSSLQAQQSGIITSTFEDPDIRNNGGTPYLEAQVWYQTRPHGSTLDGWTVASGSVDVVRHLNATSRDGAQSIDLNGVEPGVLRRVFNTVPGIRYRLSFDFSGNPINGLIRVLEVRWNGKPLETFEWNSLQKGNSFQNDMKWENHQVESIASSTNTIVELASVRSGMSGPQIDNIVFEPAGDSRLQIESAVLITWPVPSDGPLGTILESAEKSEGPWTPVKSPLLQLTPDGRVAVTLPASNAARFYRLRP